MRRLACPFLLVACSLVACGRKEGPPPPRHVQPQVLAWFESGALERAPSTVLLEGRTFSQCATSWAPDAIRRRWAVAIPEASLWAKMWIGPGTVRLVSETQLQIDLVEPDPELPDRFHALSGPHDGRWVPGGFLTPTERLFQARDTKVPSLRVRSVGDLRKAISDFDAGRLTRLDLIPSDRAASLRDKESFRATETAETFALLVDVADPAIRAAVADALDPVALCRRALFDPSRAARRLTPPMFRLAGLPAARKIEPSTKMDALTLDADPAPDAQLLLPAVRAALRSAGFKVSDPDPGTPAQLHLACLVAPTPAPGDFFARLRPLSTPSDRLGPILAALASTVEPDERGSWYLAWEAALIEDHIAIPLARGMCYSLVRAGCAVELDEYRRWRPLRSPSER